MSLDMIPEMSGAMILALALILDAFTGDPKWLYQRLPHPVTLMAGFLMTGERWLNRTHWRPFVRRVTGLGLIVIAVALMGAVGWLVEYGLAMSGLQALIAVIIISLFLAARGLFDHVRDVHLALTNNENLDQARAAVGKIIGRKTENLDAPGITRATVESLAENFSDGVVAPAMWFLVGGLPGLLIYKMVNTADSMIGYRNERYQDFGWAAARLDDLLNLVPARLTAILFSLAALPEGRSKAAISTAWHQAKLHLSPNAGWPEAAMAGALEIRLGGPRCYPGNIVVDGHWFGTGADADTASIAKAIRICKLAWLVMVFGLICWGWL